MVKVIHLKDINTSAMFKTKAFMLGPGTGNYFVVEDDLYLGRYEFKYQARDHAESLNLLDNKELKWLK